MGIIASPRPQTKVPETTAKRKSIQDSLAGLKPLKPGGAMGFSGFRDPSGQSASSSKSKAKGPKADSDMDSDDEEADVGGKTPVRNEDNEAKDSTNMTLSLEDAQRQDEVAEGVKKIRV